MNKIIVYNNFGDDRSAWVKRLSKQSPEGHKWKNVELVTDIRESDYVVVLDGVGLMDKEEFEIFMKKDKIFIQREPEQVQGRININPDKFVKVVTYNTHPTYADWWLDMDYDQLRSLSYESLKKDKKNPICVVTDKAFTDGQRKRLGFLCKAQHMHDIDFYGKPSLRNLFANYHGVPEYEHTSTRDKSRILEYGLSISLENGSRRNFFTRTNEDFLCWALPVYWGCPNLQDFFPEDSYRYIDIEAGINKKQLEHLLRPPEKHEISAIAEARDLILNKYNFFPFIESVLAEL